MVSSKFTLKDIESLIDNREWTARVKSPRIGYEVSKLVLKRLLGFAAFGFDIDRCSYEKLVCTRTKIGEFHLNQHAMFDFDGNRTLIIIILLTLTGVKYNEKWVLQDKKKKKNALSFLCFICII